MSIITNEGGFFIGNINQTVIQNYSGNTSGVYLLGDLAGNVYTDFIYEVTTNQGVNIEGVIVKNGNISANMIQAEFVGNILGNIIGDSVGNVIGPVICATDHVETDLITPKTQGGNINIGGIIISGGEITSGNVLVSGNVIGDTCGNVYTNFVFEKTTNSGVTLTGDLIVIGNIVGGNVMTSSLWTLDSPDIYYDSGRVVMGANVAAIPNLANNYNAIICGPGNGNSGLFIKAGDTNLTDTPLHIEDQNATIQIMHVNAGGTVGIGVDLSDQSSMPTDTALYIKSGTVHDGIVDAEGGYRVDGVNLNINHLDDVNTSGVSTDDILTWNGSSWIPNQIGNKYIGCCFNELRTNSTSYTVLTRFIFPGTTNLGSVNNINVIARKASFANSYDVRIWNFSNAQQIASVTGLTNTTLSIVNMGTLSNLPSSQSIFEVQLRRVGGSGRVYLNAVQIEHDI